MTAESKRVRDLQRLLEQLCTLHEELFALIDSKVDSMRRADVQALTECSAREIALTQRLAERESVRGQLMDAIGVEFGMPGRAGRKLTVSQLAERLVEPQRGTLVAAADRLRGRVFKVMQANRMAGAVSLELLNHLRWVMNAVRPRPEKPAAYSVDGALVSSGPSALLELVG